MRLHLDTDFLVCALASSGPERKLLLDLADSSVELQMSAVAWYEFARGPRTEDQLAVARSFFAEDGIVPFSEDIAGRAGRVFQNLGSPRRRANDIAIGVTAVAMNARLVSRNGGDFVGIPGLEVETAG